MVLSWKQKHSIFDIHYNNHPFPDRFYIEMLTVFTLLLIKIEIKPHLKTLISPTCYNINSSNY